MAGKLHHVWIKPDLALGVRPRHMISSSEEKAETLQWVVDTQHIYFFRRCIYTLGETLSESSERLHEMKNNKSNSEQDVMYTDIMRTYGGKCVMCGLGAVTVHEEPPRSLNPNWLNEPENRYALCNSCHEYVHTISRADAKELLEFYRKERLASVR